MSTHMPGFRSSFNFFSSFLLAKLATSSIRVKGLLKFIDSIIALIMLTLFGCLPPCNIIEKKSIYGLKPHTTNDLVQ